MKSENEKSILCETYYRGEGLRMTMDEKIKTSNELEFAVFCIENVAAKLGVDAERVYQAFTEHCAGIRSAAYPEQGVYR